jgi:hypothetical protein
MTSRIQKAALSNQGRHFARRKVLNRITAGPAVLCLALCLFIVVNSFDASAQTASTGALTGTVTDPSAHGRHWPRRVIPGFAATRG